ncbi:MAG: MmcQ/YjbR family DNA-binding protein [Bacteroidales bacterium]|jgi:predicted DNA-binding protein (MmcQ/YjbR family)|nr:MmcQ/YjbR family DNA-binding protein [Bacteroidales bacterium]
MNIEEIRNYCIEKDFVTESMPFGDDVLVFKVAGKMFLVANLSGATRISIKASPEEVFERLEKHPDTEEAYHFNKKHWISVKMDEAANFNRVRSWIDRSYTLVLEGVSKKVKREIGLAN